MYDPVITMLTLIMLGQICLTVPLLLIQGIKAAVYLPLALFLLANGILAANSIVYSSFPNWYVLYTAIAFPALFALCPSLWLYVKGITSDLTWQVNRQHARHFILLCPSLIVSAMILLLPGDIHSELFVENRDVSHPLAMTIAFGILIMMFLWLGQCLYTVVLVIRRLITHRAQLKHLYSNKEQRDLSWLSWLTFHAVIVWFVTLSTLFTSNLFDHWLLNETNEAILALFLIWSLCHFGLQQRPVNSEQSSNAVKTKVNVIENNEQKPATKKYQRSALGNEQATRIASKINKAMKDDALYLDADLSLQKLANILGISPNYISQTLNETLKSNFFDFVNHWRIEAAKPLVLANQHSILNIALDVGFNARSSFYKAFKKETGNTPSEFRKSNAPLCQWVRENEDGAK